MSDQIDKDQRRNIRVEFSANIKIKLGDSELNLEGNCKDLSLKGIFVNTSEDIPLGTKCAVGVQLTGMTEEIAIQMVGTVSRKTAAGFAVAFESMDLDSYTHLKNIIRYNAENPDDIY